MMTHDRIESSPGRKRAALAITVSALAALAAMTGCAGEYPEDAEGESAVEGPRSGRPLTVEIALADSQRRPRYQLLRDAARGHGITRTAFLLAGIANDETGLAMCWSEATWACQGPASPDCGGGPIIAGAADGPCSSRQGGLGLFQFDAGTYQDTLNRYGNSVLTLQGQVQAAIAYVVNMVKISAYTQNAETDAKALAWINNFDVNNATLRDQWIRTVVRYYNGCQPGWRCWSPRYQTYSDGLRLALDQVGGTSFWAAGAMGGTPCGGSPATVGKIDEKYRALGGCGSVLGAPISEEKATPDGGGRYTVFERGSIYWSAQTGAFEVHGRIRDHWKELGWEAGALGYPISDEYAAGNQRKSNFQRGTINWDPATDKFIVEGAPPAQPWKVLNAQHQVQETGYWCGPAATRAALSARMAPPTQATLASQLGTTTRGTDWIGQVTSVLNQRLGATRYLTVEMPNDPPTPAQRDRLWRDIVRSIDANYPVVTNIVAPPNNHPPGYPNETIYHYFTVIGYNQDTAQVYIADSANFGGNKLYWLSFQQLSTLIPPKGYSAWNGQ